MNDRASCRFATGTDAHIMWAPSSFVDTMTLQRLRMPSYVIFDEDTRTRGAVAATFYGKVSDVYQWSADNSREIAKGWIKVADSVAGLAPQIKMRADILQSTVARYNLQCVGGYDPEFGRLAEHCVPIGRPRQASGPASRQAQTVHRTVCVRARPIASRWGRAPDRRC